MRCTPGSQRSHVSAAASESARIGCRSHRRRRCRPGRLSRRAGSPRRRRRTPRRRTAASACTPARPPSRYPRRFDSYAARRARCPASGTTSDFSSTPRATSTSRSAARATIPLCEANGAAATRSACTTAATSSAGADGRRGQQPAPRPAAASAASASRGRPSCVVGHASRPPASAWIRASACARRPAEHRRQRQQLGRHPERGLRDLVAGARRGPRPGTTPTPRGRRSRGRRGAATRRSSRARYAAARGRAASRRSRRGPRRTPTARPRGTPARQGDRGRRRSRPVRLCQGGPATQRVACSRWMTSSSDQARSFGSVAEAYDRGRPSFPREAAEWLVGARAGDRARARRRHRQAHRAAGRARPRRARDRPRRRRCSTILRRDLPGRPDHRAPAPRRSPSPTGRSTSWSPRSASTGSTSTGRCPRSRGCSSPAASSRWSGTCATSGSRGSAGSAGSSAARSSRRRRAPSRWCSPACSASSRTRRSRTGRTSTASRSRTWCSPAPTSPCSTTTRGRPSSPRCCAFYDDYGRGMDGMQLPYDACCFRAVVNDRPDDRRPPTEDGDVRPTSRRSDGRRRHAAHRLPVSRAGDGYRPAP